MKKKASLGEFDSSGIYQTEGRRNHTQDYLYSYASHFLQEYDLTVLICIVMHTGIGQVPFLKFTGFNLIVGIDMLSETKN